MTWIGVILMGAVGLFLSAFFSGSETGFYRATRLRLVLDALAGDRVSRGLAWLTNHPLLFVATTLIGNNLANYITTLAIVMGTHLVTGPGHVAELFTPLLFVPVFFVYGELLPKNLFLQAPNRLLRRGGPLFLLCVGLFAPITSLLWALNVVLGRLAGRSPEQVRLTLARRELHQVLEEGHEAGILRPAQRGLARGVFAMAHQPVGRFTTPLEQLPRARSDMSKSDVLRLARRYRIAVVPVEAAGAQGELVGYLRVIDLGLSKKNEVGPLYPMLDIADDTSHVAALTQMQSANESLARVVNAKGQTAGVITVDRLRETLFHSDHTDSDDRALR
ncbi:MAG: DUF21 domain-containing protein [Pirellulales bacterium]|nr:DUF21 domain-containing protein [Pirellulales bacterium]